MKRTITNTMLLMAIIMVSLGFSPIDEKGKVHLKVTKEENGEITVFEKVYATMDELKADAELLSFDVLVDQWANEKGHKMFHIGIGDHDGEKTIIIKKKIDGDENLTWISEDNEGIHDGDHRVVIKHKDGKEEKIIKAEKVIKIKTDKDGSEITIKIDEDGVYNMLFIDEEGNKTKFSDDHIEKMIQGHMEGEGEKIHKKIEVIISDEGNGEQKVIVMKGDDDAKEIEVEVKIEIGEDGEEKIIEKKVWITKDGKKIELDGENDFQFETDGNKITIKVDSETIDLKEISEDDHVVVVKKIKKGKDGEGSNQTMNINIEEKNGEQFIEIDIKRTSALNVTISDINKDDASLSGIDYSLKSNLKLSELKFYPNPNNGRFNLKFKLDQQKEVTVKVMDILGNEVYKERIIDFEGSYDNQIDLTGKGKGIYILQIIQKKKAFTQKILIE